MIKGVRLIATGIALTHKMRVNKVALINEEINAIAETLRSSSDVDGMPHSGSVTDPVSAKAIKIEALENVRAIEQERINAVEWAEQCLYDRTDPVEFDRLVGLVWALLSGDEMEVDKYIDREDKVALNGAQRVKTRFLNDIANYLRLTDY